MFVWSNSRRRMARLVIAVAAAISGLVGVLTAASADDGGPKPNGWPTATCSEWHPCTSPPATTAPPATTPAATTTTTTPPATTTTTRAPSTSATTPASTTTAPVWTEPQLPVTGARPAVVGWSIAFGATLLAGGVLLLLLRRRRTREGGVA
jgi:hypothetical protein